MAQWIQSQSFFLLAVLVVWIVFTCLAIAIGNDCEPKGYMVWRRVNELCQVLIFLLISGNFIAYGPAQATLAYFRIHWIFASIILFISFCLSLAMLVFEFQIGGIVTTVAILIVTQILFQNDGITLTLALFYGIGYIKTLEIFDCINKYLDVQVSKIMNFIQCPIKR